MRRTLYGDEHLAFAEAFRTFRGREVLPYFDEWEAAGIVPREVFREAGRHGFLGFEAPNDFGGVGVDDFRFNAVLGEEGYLAGVAGLVGGGARHQDNLLPHFFAYPPPHPRGRRGAGAAPPGPFAGRATDRPAPGAAPASLP